MRTTSDAVRLNVGALRCVIAARGAVLRPGLELLDSFSGNRESRKLYPLLILCFFLKAQSVTGNFQPLECV